MDELRKIINFNQIIIGGCCAAFAAVITNPLDVVKTRMQLQGELTKSSEHVFYKGVIDAFVTIYNKEGLTSFANGVQASVFYQLICDGIRLGTYQNMVEMGYMHDEEGNAILQKRVFYSGICGSIGGTLATPFNIMRVQLQSAASVDELAHGHQHMHNGMVQGFLSHIKKHGFIAIHRVYFPSPIKLFLSSSSQLTTFDYCKEWLENSNFIPTEKKTVIRLISSFMSGIAISAVSAPFDLINTRLSNQEVMDDGRGVLYRSSWDCFLKIYKFEGIRGLLKGFFPTFIRRAPHSLISLVLWDEFRQTTKYKEDEFLNFVLAHLSTRWD